MSTCNVYEIEYRKTTLRQHSIDHLTDEDKQQENKNELFDK